MSEEYRARLIFDITEEQHLRVNRYLNQHGVKKAILSCLLDEVLDMVEEYGPICLGLIVNSPRSRDIVPALKRADTACKKLEELNVRD